MVKDLVWYSANIPADFPTHDEIVDSCTKAGIWQKGVCILIASKPRYWVKYAADHLIRAEGRTQAHVAGIVNTNPTSVVRIPVVYLGFSRGDCEYLVMDFIQGTTFAERKSPGGYYYKKDIKAVVAAVRQLTNIKVPLGTPPGPVGGGYISHEFFVECVSALKYPTVVSLEAQINEVLRLSGNSLRVDFQTECADGLVLCLSDPNGSNFMIDSKGQLWAIDFGRTCFLPPSFVYYTLEMSADMFIRSIGHCMNYPSSGNLEAMVAASSRMLIFGDNTLGAAAMRHLSGSVEHNKR